MEMQKIKPKPMVVCLLACAVTLLCAGPVAAKNNCSLLYVRFYTFDYKIGSVSCEEGKVKGAANYSNSIFIKFEQGDKLKDRIECEVAFEAKANPDERNVVRFTQNRCVMKAGNIHVRQVSGQPPIYVDYKGSYDTGRPGEVKLIGFGQNPEPPDWMVPDLSD